MTGGGAVSGFLTMIKVLTPILGFLGALLGFTAGIITLIVKLRELRASKCDTCPNKGNAAICDVCPFRKTK